MEENYNETDAAIFVHKSITQQMQQKYTIDQIEYLLDLVYEYCESDETETEANAEINLTELTSYINANIKNKYCKPITHEEVFLLLEADNLYMESIGLISPEEKTDYLTHIFQKINELYSVLSDELKNKYTQDDIYMIIILYWEYLEATEEDIDETKMYKHIQREAAERGITISIEVIEEILTVTEDFFDEE